MKTLRACFALFLLSCSVPVLSACGPGVDDTSASGDDLLDSARRKKSRCNTDQDCQESQTCTSQVCQGRTPPRDNGCKRSDDCRSGGLCDHGSCAASACNHRAPGKTGIRASVRITRYQGLIHGRSGDHEIAFGTLSHVLWIHDPATQDNSTVELALNVASSRDPAGLPHEIPLAVGETVEVEGEYISAASAGAGGAAVIHFTHSSCGFVEVNGHQYR